MVNRAFANKGKGVLAQNNTNIRLSVTMQENSKEGVRLESVTGSTINIYCEQNGWETTVGDEQTDVTMTQLSNYGATVGKVINMFALGGKGTTITTNHGVYTNFAYNNEINGIFGGYGIADLYFTTNCKNNKINAVNHMTGLLNAPTKVTNNGTMNGYSIIGTQERTRIESLSFASQSTVQSIAFAKPFTVALIVVGTVIISTSTTALSANSMT